MNEAQNQRPFSSGGQSYPSLSGEENANLLFQAREHPSVNTAPTSVAAGTLLLTHQKAYETAAAIGAGKVCLDWGCNNGYGMELMARQASRVTGVDVSSKMIAEASNRLAGSCSLALFDGQRWPLGNEYFDLVTCFQVIEHVVDPAWICHWLATASNSLGVVLVVTPNAANRLKLTERPWNRFHVREYTFDEAQRELSKAFRYVELRGLQGCDELIRIDHDRIDGHRIAAGLVPMHDNSERHAPETDITTRACSFGTESLWWGEPMLGGVDILAVCSQNSEAVWAACGIIDGI